MRPSTLIHRFHQYVDHSQSSNDCWVWKGSLDKAGYGQINEKGRVLKSHRIALELFLKRPIKKGMNSCHRCNNPPCCNPNHLYEGTPAQNWNDTIAAGTRFIPNNEFGEEHHDAKLNILKVREIRSSIESGATLARKFKVSRSSISKVRKYLTWKSVK